MTDDEYRAALLKYFSLEVYEERTIMDKTDIIFQKIKDIPMFQEKMKVAAATMLSEDLEVGLILLFSYDNFPEFRLLLEEHHISLDSLNKN
jgi:hypothetical protein